MKKIKIFLDSNVLIAGLASIKGASAIVLRLTEIKAFEVFISQQIILESERNIKKKLSEFLPYFYYAIKYLPLEVSKDFQKQDLKLAKLLSKESDQMIFQTVSKIKPDYFLTLNRKHFHQKVIKKMANFIICTPAQFLDEWKDIKISDFE